MTKRPTSVTVIAWILIAIGGGSLITTTTMMNNPMVLALMSKSPIPVPLQYAMSYLGLLITIVSGIAMLNGRNWGRFLYVIWSIIGFVIGFFISPMKTALLPGLVLIAIIAFFLFRPKATAYFLPAKPADDTQPA